MSESDFRCGHVAVVGRSNAGKSTLVNRLVGRKVTIVSRVPQTTRHVIVGVRNEPDAQVVLVDTPGVHKPQHELNRRMLEQTWGALAGVDAVVVVIDASDRMGRGDAFILERVNTSDIPHVVALNKVDRIPRKGQLLPLIERLARPEAGAAPVAVVPISARDGTGVDGLLAELKPLLPAHPAVFPRDLATDQSERFMVAELIREKILEATRQEVPHATTVLVSALGERTRADGRRLVVVEATIGVERESQKGILIGKGGDMLKRIGTAARLDVEAQLGASCHLALVVAVLPRWRDDRRELARLYSDTRSLAGVSDVVDLKAGAGALADESE